MPQDQKFGIAPLRQRLRTLFPDRHITIGSAERTHSVRLSARAQMLALGIAATAIVGGSLTALSAGADLTRQRAAIERQGRSVSAAENRLAQDRRSVESLARRLEERQNFMDDLYRTHFGGKAGDDADLIGDDRDVGKDGGKDKAEKIVLSSRATPLLRLERRQQRFALALTRAVERRADKAAAAIRSFGLNPDRLARTAARAQGGPFVPWTGDKGAMTGELEQLADAMSRMEFLERSLLAIPSGKPTATPMLSSSYGYRRDPFNGHAAFHAGLDFPGRSGQPINAAAGGRISFVGQRQGYGNVVEITHGNGLMTRYAHLSGFAAKVGQDVARGDKIGRMGSTGRSTGTHLHFEVRLNDRPINPRRFLDARGDVAQAQRLAKARVAEVGRQG